jgi:hypothetical protein
VLFSTQVGYPDMEPAGEELVVAYLVGPDGMSFEITRWTVDDAPRWIHDVRPDGRLAIVAFGDDAALLDLTTGNIEPLPAGVGGPFVTFTRPTGRDYVMAKDDGTVEMRLSDGSLVVDFGQTLEWFFDYGVPERPWLYGPEGLTAVVNRPDGPELIDNRGNLIRKLDDAGAECVALRWWSVDDILVRCDAESDERWLVRRLWLVDRRGVNSPLALTTGDESQFPPEFMGYVDALLAGSAIVLQGEVAVGGGWFPIEKWNGSESAVPLGDMVAGQLVTATPDVFAVFRLGCCGEVYGGLTYYDLTGRQMALLDAPDGIFGVLDAHGVGAP